MKKLYHPLRLLLILIHVTNVTNNVSRHKVQLFPIENQFYHLNFTPTVIKNQLTLCPVMHTERVQYRRERNVQREKNAAFLFNSVT